MTNEFNPDWMCVCGDLTALGVVHLKDGPCYYPEPKREWVGLTDEEVIDLWPDLIMHKHTYQFWQNLEAKLKEKNG